MLAVTFWNMALGVSARGNATEGAICSEKSARIGGSALSANVAAGFTINLRRHTIHLCRRTLQGDCFRDFPGAYVVGRKRVRHLLRRYPHACGDAALAMDGNNDFPLNQWCLHMTLTKVYHDRILPHVKAQYPAMFFLHVPAPSSGLLKPKPNQMPTREHFAPTFAHRVAIVTGIAPRRPRNHG